MLVLDRRSRYLVDGDLVCGRLLAHAAADDDPAVQEAARQVLRRLARGTDRGADTQAWIEHWDLVAQARRLKDAPPDELSDALRDADWQARRLAAAAVAEAADRQHRLGDHLQARVGVRLGGDAAGETGAAE